MPLHQRVADLHFYLFEGVLHPEFFEIWTSRTYRRNSFRADVWLTGMGHVVVVSNEEVGVSEVVCSACEVLPWHRLLHTVPLGQRIEDTYTGRLRTFVYHTAFSRERLSAEAFAAEHAGLLSDVQPTSILLAFPVGKVGGLEPFVLIDVEATQRHLAVQAVHAFPHERTLVKTQSLFELEGRLG